MTADLAMTGRGAKSLIFSLLALLVAGCSVLQSNPWDWLNNPSAQIWRDIQVTAFGREIRFQVPDRKSRGGEHVRIWPQSESGDTAQWSVTANFESLNNPQLPVAQFRWDEYWGGFYKPGDRDFTLTIQVYEIGDHAELLDLSADERIQRRLDYYHKIYSEPGTFWTDYFFERYWVRSYETDHHVWVVENQPQVTWHHEYYLIPISDRIELAFKFFVRDKRWDWKDDPEWRESRWAIVRQIMDTVQITPSPFPDEP